MMVFCLIFLLLLFQQQNFWISRALNINFILSYFHLSRPAVLTCCKCVLIILPDHLLSSCWETEDRLFLFLAMSWSRNYRLEFPKWLESHWEEKQKSFGIQSRGTGYLFLAKALEQASSLCSFTKLFWPPGTGGLIHFPLSLLRVWGISHIHLEWCQSSPYGFQIIKRYKSWEKQINEWQDKSRSYNVVSLLLVGSQIPES